MKRSSNFIRFKDYFPVGAKAPGMSILGNCHDVLRDPKFCNSYYNSIGLSLFSPPYGEHAVTGEGHQPTVSELKNELITFFHSLINANVWVDNHLVVIETGKGKTGITGNMITYPEHLQDIVNNFQNVTHVDTINYSRSGHGTIFTNHLMVLCLSNYGVKDITFRRVRQLKNDIQTRERAYGGGGSVLGQEQYRNWVKNVISNKHFMPVKLTADILSGFPSTVVADWYSGSNLTGAAASYHGHEWVSVEKDEVQWVHQKARFSEKSEKQLPSRSSQPNDYKQAKLKYIGELMGQLNPDLDFNIGNLAFEQSALLKYGDADWLSQVQRFGEEVSSDMLNDPNLSSTLTHTHALDKSQCSIEFRYTIGPNLSWAGFVGKNDDCFYLTERGYRVLQIFVNRGEISIPDLNNHEKIFTHINQQQNSVNLDNTDHAVKEPA